MEDLILVPKKILDAMGNLASASELVVGSTSFNFSERVKNLNDAVNEYNSIVLEIVQESNKNQLRNETKLTRNRKKEP